MKKLLFKLIWVFILVFSLTCGCLIALDNKQSNVKATDVTNPKIEILKNNVSYSDSIYIAYAVSCEGFEINKNTVSLLFWNATQENYIKGTEDALGTSKGKTNINGKQCLIFYSEGLAAKHMTDDLYSRAYVVIDGVEYYSEVVKFSVLEYVYKMKEEATLNPHQQRLFDTLLQYGGAAQDNFDYNTNKKADATYYKITVTEGILPDGFKHGRYQLNEKVVIKPLSKPGQKFSHWLDQNGIIVSYDKEFEITVTDKNEYTAIYKDISNVSSQLKMEYEVTYDGTVDDLDLPNAVSITIGEETYTHEIIWDLTTFIENKVGKQKLYASFVDETLYTEYNLTKEDIYVEVNVLPFTYEIDQTTGNYTLTGYYGTDELVEIPSLYKNTTITKIATKAFNEVLTLKEVVIPTTIEEIELSAFFYCDNIEKMTIPFTGSKATNSSNNSHFGYIFGATSHENQKDLIPLKLTSITLTEGATIVGESAFSGLSQITEFNIPSSLEYIYSYAFSYCTALTSFYINENLKGVGLDAFSGCTNLKRVDVDSLEILFNLNIAPSWSGGSEMYTPLQNGADLYINNELIKEIAIPSYAVRLRGLLSGCSSIEKITISNEITNIKCAFHNMENLKTVIFEENSKLTSIGSSAFSRCSSLESITIPSSVTSIGSSAFRGCSSLTSITIPSSVTSIGSSAFRGCSSFESITIPSGVSIIESYTFYYCTSLRQVNLPSSLTTIKSGAFEDCSSLTSIELPYRLRSIGDSAFEDCSSLTSITIPSSVTSIGSYAFEGCSSLTSITLPNSVTSIGSYAFRYCSNLTSITLPSSVTSIGKYAFNYCSSLYIIYNNSELELELGSTNNGYVAYYAKEIINSDGTVITNDGHSYEITDDGFVFEYYNNEYTLVSYIGTNDTVTLPLTINDCSYKIYRMKGVKNVVIPNGIINIDDEAFYHCKTLTSIIIPEGVTCIGQKAFEGCSNLTSITLPSSVTSIGSYAFSECSSLTNVYYEGSMENWCNISFSNSYSNLMYYADHFYMKNEEENWYEVTEIIIPNTITEIGNWQFHGFENVTSITIPSSVTSIGTSAFSYCTAEIIWDNSTITEIGDYAFYKYKGTSITIPSSVTSIEYYAFYGCSNLTSITLPSSVTSIGDYAFYECSNLTSITIPSSVTSIEYYAFYGCSNLTIYCEVAEKPSTWNSNWNYSNCPVVWGYKED